MTRAALVLAFAAACASSSSTGPMVAIRELRAARDAHGRKDWPAFLAHTRAAVAASPGDPSSRYDLACALALTGRAEEAAVELDRLTVRDLTYDLDRDSDFDPIRTTPAFMAARARMGAVREKHTERSPVALTLGDPDLLTEGIAYDATSGAFFVSSVHKRKIVRIAKDGTASDFVGERRDGLFGALALAVDAKRGLLWACSSAMPEMSGFRPEDGGHAALYAFELSTGRLRARIEPPAAPRHNCNDLAVDAHGGVFVSDPLVPTIYRVEPGGRTMTPLVERGALVAPQGLLIEPDGKSLLVADYMLGLARVEIGSGRVHVLPAPADAALAGIDGLCAVGGTLVAIQNGIEPNRAARIVLSASRDRIERVEVIDFNHSAFREPTLCTTVGRDVYYIAASQWSRFAPGALAETREPPTVLRLTP